MDKSLLPSPCIEISPKIFYIFIQPHLLTNAHLLRGRELTGIAILGIFASKQMFMASTSGEFRSPKLNKRITLRQNARLNLEKKSYS